MEQIHFLVNKEGDIIICKSKFLPYTNKKPSRYKIQRTDFSFSNLEKAREIGSASRSVDYCLEQAYPGYRALSQGEVIYTLEFRYKHENRNQPLGV